MLLLAAFLPGVARAGVGSAGALVLLEPLAARPAALGEACAAPPAGADALAYNPAGLAALRGGEVSAMYHGGFSGDTVLSGLGGAPFPGGGFAAAAGYHNSGSVEKLLPTGELTEVSAQRDVVAVAGAGAAIPGTELAVGVAAEVVHTQLIEEIEGTQGAASLGLTWSRPAWGLAAGVAGQHLGPGLALAQDRVALPAVVRAGLAWRASVPAFGTLPDLAGGPAPERTSHPHRFLFLAQVESRSREGAVVLAAGAEYEYAGVLALRGGARDLARGGASRQRRYAVGLGIRVLALRLDYALELLPFAALHRVSLTFAPRPPEDAP